MAQNHDNKMSKQQNGSTSVISVQRGSEDVSPINTLVDGRKDSGSSSSSNMDFEDASETIEHMETDYMTYDSKSSKNQGKEGEFAEGTDSNLENSKPTERRDSYQKVNHGSNSVSDKSDDIVSNLVGDLIKPLSCLNIRDKEIKSLNNDNKDSKHSISKDKGSTDEFPNINDQVITRLENNHHNYDNLKGRCCDMKNDAHDENQNQYSEKNGEPFSENQHGVQSITSRDCSENRKECRGIRNENISSVNHNSHSVGIQHGRYESSINKTDKNDRSKNHHEDYSKQICNEEKNQQIKNLDSESSKDTNNDRYYSPYHQSRHARNSSSKNDYSDRACGEEQWLRDNYKKHGNQNEKEGHWKYGKQDQKDHWNREKQSREREDDQHPRHHQLSKEQEYSSRKDRSREYRDSRQLETNAPDRGDSSDEQEFYDVKASGDKTERYDHPGNLPASSEVPTYTKLNWTTYIENHVNLPDWNVDVLDSFEVDMAQSVFGGGGGKKKFFRDLVAYEHHDDADDGKCRGWDRGECVYVDEASLRVTRGWSDGRHEAQHSLKKDDDYGSNMGSRQIVKGGARPKTYAKHDEREQDSYREKFEDSQNDVARSYRGSSSRSIDSDLCTSDEETLQEESKYSSLPAGPMNYKGPSSDDGSEKTRYTQDRRGNRRDDAENANSKHRTNKTLHDVGSAESPAAEYEEFNPYCIVEYLSQQKDFLSDIRRFVGKSRTYGMVNRVLTHNSHIFFLNENMVELKPKVSLCPQYLSLKGCSYKSSCDGLHICIGYILKNCKNHDCMMGHKLFTGHNSKVLKEFCLDKLEPSVIHGILESIFGKPEDSQELDVCSAYNTDKCRDDNCSALHICIDYVSGLSDCCRPECKLNHDLNADNCFRILISLGINISNSPDIEGLLEVIAKSSKLTRLVQSIEKSGQSAIQPTKQSPRTLPLSNASSSKLGQAYNASTQSNSQPAQRLLSAITPSNDQGSQRSQAYDLSDKSNTRSSYQSPKSHKPRNTQVSQVQSSPTGNSHIYPKSDNISRVTAASKITGTHSSQNATHPSVHQQATATSFDQNTSNSGANHKQTYSSIVANTATKVLEKLNPFSSTNNVNQSASTHKSLNHFSTVWSHYPQGETQIDMICSYALKNGCKFESSGCKKLHSKLPFHWQVKVSKTGSKKADWINLQSHQVIDLEQHYCDPSKETVKLLPADTNSLPNILPVLLGQDVLVANFELMQLVNTNYTEIWPLRRLSIEIVGNDQLKVYHHLWYFKDNSGTWVSYGDADTTGDTDLATKVSSLGIERQYLKNNRYMNIKNSVFNYTLDFTSKTQKNKKTGVIREVRRRPQPPLWNSIQVNPNARRV